MLLRWGTIRRQALSAQISCAAWTLAIAWAMVGPQPGQLPTHGVARRLLGGRPPHSSESPEPAQPAASLSRAASKQWAESNRSRVGGVLGHSPNDPAAGWPQPRATTSRPYGSMARSLALATIGDDLARPRFHRAGPRAAREDRRRAAQRAAARCGARHARTNRSARLTAQRRILPSASATLTWARCLRTPSVSSRLAAARVPVDCVLHELRVGRQISLRFKLWRWVSMVLTLNPKASAAWREDWPRPMRSAPAARGYSTALWDRSPGPPSTGPALPLQTGHRGTH